MKILAFAGSNSTTSINKELVNYAAAQLTAHEVKIVDLNDYEMPIYSPERQAAGFPQQAVDFHQAIKDADGLIISLAEHNGNFSVALKNILDWVSRIEMPYLKDKKILLLATSPGGYGGGNVLEVGLKTFVHFASGEVVASSTFPSFYDNFKEGTIVNEELKASIDEKIKAFENALVAVEA